MAFVERVESGDEGLSLHPNAPLKRVKRENERKQSVRVCLFMVFLMADFVEDNTTKHIPPLSVQIETVA